jgi:hypothetical protein
MENKLELQLNEVNSFADLFNSMLKTKGHGLTFQLSKNKYELSLILKKVEKQVEIAKKVFFKEEYKAVYNEKGFVRKYNEKEDNEELKEGENIGFKLTKEDEIELNLALEKLAKQKFEVELFNLDNELFEKACEKGIFDEIDVMEYFGFKNKFLI